MPTMQLAETSPFDLLSKEVIIDIVRFLHGDAKDAQLRKLMGISRLWRGMLLDLPPCWSGIKVEIAHERGYEWLLLQLQRSKSQPLEVSITHKPSFNVSGMSTRKLDALFAHSTRWRSLFLDVQIDILTTRFAPIQGQLPILASLELKIKENSYNYDNWYTLPPLFQNAPCLTIVSIGTATKVDLSTLPLHQIRHFWINESFWPPVVQQIPPGPPHLSNLLQSTSQCQYLDVTPSETTQWGTQGTTAPQLLSINIQDYREDMDWLSRLPPLLDILTAPSLRRLTVTSPSPSNIGVIDNFLARSPPMSRKVEELELMLMPFSSDHRRILHMCPLLTTLTLSFNNISDMDPLQELADPSFLPNLATVKFFIEADEHPQWLGPRGPEITFDRWTQPQDSDYASSLVDQLVERRCEAAAPGGASPCPRFKPLSKLQLLWPSEDAAKGYHVYTSRDHSVTLDPKTLTQVQDMSDFVARGATTYWRSDGDELGRLDMLLDEPFLREIGNAQYLYRSGLHISFHTFLVQSKKHGRNMPINFGYLDYLGVPCEIRHRMAKVLKYLVSVLEADVSRLHWRYDRGSTVYTPADHEMRKNNDAVGMIFGKTVKELSQDCQYDWNEL